MSNKQFDFFGQIQTSQTGCQPYSDTSPMVSVPWSIALLEIPINLVDDALRQHLLEKDNNTNMCEHIFKKINRMV